MTSLSSSPSPSPAKDSHHERLLAALGLIAETPQRDSGGDVRSDVQIRELQPLTLVKVSGPQRGSRIHASLTDHNDAVILFFSRSGQCTLAQRGQQLTLVQNEAAFIDQGQSYFFEQFAGETLCVKIARVAFSGIVRDLTRVFPCRAREDDPGLGLIATYLGAPGLGLLTAPEHTPTAQVIATHLRDFVTAALRGSLPRTRPSSPGFQMIKRDVLANLPRHSLSAEVIASWYGINVRTLQRIFGRSGVGVSAFILDERLTLARRRLENGEDPHRKIEIIARECGFNSISHFNHAFRRKFDVPPTAIRAAASAMDRNSSC